MESQSRQAYAALLTYWCEEVNGARWISWDYAPSGFVKKVAGDLARWLAMLVEHHTEYVNVSELELLHEAFGEGDYPEDGWSSLEVLDLLKKLPSLAETEFEKTGCSVITDCSWYADLVDFLNDAFPRDDGVWVTFAGRLDRFLPELLAFEAESFDELYKVKEYDAIRLGRLAELSRLSWFRDVPRERWQALHQYVEDFNSRNWNLGDLD